jgi:hypothetical protein
VDADGQVLETFRADDDGGDGYIVGVRIAELTQDADVVFTGDDRRLLDLAVGAGGPHSALRAMVFGPHERFVRRQ